MKHCYIRIILFTFTMISVFGMSWSRCVTQINSSLCLPTQIRNQLDFTSYRIYSKWLFDNEKSIFLIAKSSWFTRTVNNGAGGLPTINKYHLSSHEFHGSQPDPALPQGIFIGSGLVHALHVAHRAGALTGLGRLVELLRCWSAI